MCLEADIIDFWLSTQAFPETFYRVVANQPGDITAGIVEIPEEHRSSIHLLTCLDTCRQITRIYKMSTEVAGLSNTMRSLRIVFIGPFGIFFVIEISDIVWACYQTISTSYASMLIDNDYPVLTLVSSFHGTDLGTRRFITMIA